MGTKKGNVMFEQSSLATPIRKSATSKDGNHQGTSSTFARRSFLRRIGIGGGAFLPMAGWLGSRVTANADHRGESLKQGDVAILRFLAAAEILETDLWQQYNELALGNAAFQQALFALDGDMPTYVNQNTRDEISHAQFLNAYLASKGARPVNCSARCRAARRLGRTKTRRD